MSEGVKGRSINRRVLLKSARRKMMAVQSNADNSFDAIVIGSGKGLRSRV